jgi:hypothetical protein
LLFVIGPDPLHQRQPTNPQDPLLYPTVHSLRLV